MGSLACLAAPGAYILEGMKNREPSLTLATLGAVLVFLSVVLLLFWVTDSGQLAIPQSSQDVAIHCLDGWPGISWKPIDACQERLGVRSGSTYPWAPPLFAASMVAGLVCGGLAYGLQRRAGARLQGEG